MTRELKLETLVKACQEGRSECCGDAVRGKLVEVRNVRTGRRELVRVK